MAERRTRRTLGTALMLVAGLLAAGAACGSEEPGAGGDDTLVAPDTTLLAPGDSGAIALARVPDGFEITRAYHSESDDQRGIIYNIGADEDEPAFTISAAPWDDDQPVTYDEWIEQVYESGDAEGYREVEVHGQRGFVGPYTDDGRLAGTMIVWQERPDLFVIIRAFTTANVDVVALANDSYEISTQAFDDLVTGTGGGGTDGGAGMQLTAYTGEIDGDPYVLTATLPERYPLQPIDRRAGCATITFRGETATTCGGLGSTLSEARQAVLGGVNFGFGVFPDGHGEVIAAKVENRTAPWEKATAVVLPEAPDRTWFVMTFEQVCDRTVTTPAGKFDILGVPEGYPRTNCPDPAPPG